MCCEDLKISKSIFADGHNVPLAAGDNEILPASPHRVAIVFGQPDAGTVRISTDNPAVAGQGLLLSPTMPAVYLDKWTHGALVTKAWRGFNAGAASVYVLESLLSPENVCNGSQ